MAIESRDFRSLRLDHISRRFGTLNALSRQALGQRQGAARFLSGRCR